MSLTPIHTSEEDSHTTTENGIGGGGGTSPNGTTNLLVSGATTVATNANENSYAANGKSTPGATPGAAYTTGITSPSSHFSSANKQLVEHAAKHQHQQQQQQHSINTQQLQTQQPHQQQDGQQLSPSLHYSVPTPQSYLSNTSGGSSINSTGSNGMTSPLTPSSSHESNSPNDITQQVVPYPQIDINSAVMMNGQQQQQRYASLAANLQQQLQLQQQALLQQQHLQQNQHVQQQSQLQQQQQSPNSPTNPANQAFAQVLVVGLPIELTQLELAEIFSHLPAYERCGVACDPSTGLSIGRGWLVFSSTSAAELAITKMNGILIHNHTLQLSMMQPIGESTKSNIYVAGLPKQYTQQQLEQLFSTFGSIIESKILSDPSTGISRGVAFVRYDNSNSAAQAITAVNGHVMLDGMHSFTIRVKFARDHHRNADPTIAMLTGQPNLNTSPVATSGMIGTQQRIPAIYQSYIPPHIKARGDDLSQGIALFVFHIPADFTSRDLQTLFSPCATVLSARIAIHPQTLESKGFGFVTVGTLEEAHQAVTLLNGRRVGRKFIKVSFKKQQTATTPGGQQPQQMGMGGQQHHQQQLHHQQGGHHQHQHQQHQQHQQGGGMGNHLAVAAYQQQQQQQSHQQHQSQQHHRNSLDPVHSLSHLAAALNLSGFNSPSQASQQHQQQMNGGVGGATQNYGSHLNGWNTGSVHTPTSPATPSNHINYGGQAVAGQSNGANNGTGNANMPLNFLMQQLQLNNVAVAAAAAAQVGQYSNAGQPHTPSGGQSSIYSYSPNALHAQQQHQQQAVAAGWPSPIVLPQSVTSQQQNAGLYSPINSGAGTIPNSNYYM